MNHLIARNHKLFVPSFPTEWLSRENRPIYHRENIVGTGYVFVKILLFVIKQLEIVNLT